MIARGVTVSEEALSVDLADLPDHNRAAGMVPAFGAWECGGAGSLVFYWRRHGYPLAGPR